MSFHHNFLTRFKTPRGLPLQPGVPLGTGFTFEGPRVPVNRQTIFQRFRHLWRVPQPQFPVGMKTTAFQTAIPRERINLRMDSATTAAVLGKIRAPSSPPPEGQRVTHFGRTDPATGLRIF